MPDTADLAHVSDAQLRKEVAAWLKANWDPSFREGGAGQAAASGPRSAWLAKVVEARWAAPRWPTAWYGRGLSDAQGRIVEREFARVGAPGTGQDRTNLWANTLLARGTEALKTKLVPALLRGEVGMCLLYSEPGAGSDLAGVRTRADFKGDHYVVNGQKVWTSGAHDADVLLTFVRTDPDAPKHKGISVLVIPTDTPGIVRRPFASICAADDLDFNEVFFTDVRVPVENLVGEENQGWGVANGSLGHERTMMWLGFADRMDNLIADFHPKTALERDRYATTIMDKQALRLLGSVALARAARGEDDVAAISVLKLFGSEAELRGFEFAQEAAGSDGLIHPGQTGPYAAMNLDHYFASWFERYARSFSGTIAGGTSEIQRNIIAQRILGLPRG